MSSALVIQPLLSLAYVTLGINIPLFNGLFVLKPWRFFILTTSALPLICFCMMLKLPESPKFLLVQGKTSETLKILNEIYKVNNRKNKENQVDF